MTAGGASSLRSWRGGGGRGLIGAVEEVTSRTGGASPLPVSSGSGV